MNESIHSGAFLSTNKTFINTSRLQRASFKLKQSAAEDKALGLLSSEELPEGINEVAKLRPCTELEA